MGFVDWLIVLVPLAFVLGMGVYSRKYVKSVADYLVAGRLCGRYVISIGDVANALSIIGLVAYVEMQYKTGFALAFWNRLMLPLSIILALTGYCTYRFRETKAMSLGQFLEMRYNRPFRIFAAALRSLSEILANMIMPAIAARFFIYFLNLPYHIDIFGFRIPTFMLIVVIVLTMAISLICMGGTLSLVITDAIQGMLCYPLLVVFVIFILWKFSWSTEIVPVMMDRVAGESFLNPYDVENLRDFNVFMLIITFIAMIIHRASWIGAGTSSAAKTPHEQKMASLLGTWRGALGGILYVLIAISIITIMNHKNFAGDAQHVRTQITHRVADDIIHPAPLAEKIKSEMSAIPPQIHQIGIDKPLSEKNNLDLTYLNKAHNTLVANLKESEGNSKFQEFRTLYYQMMMSVSMRDIFPPIMLGLFCLLMVLAMLSTDDTRIYSASLTITQDVVMPLRKKPFTPKQHIFVIRLVSIGVGVFFCFGSFFMSQLDYINLFVTIMCMMWMGGCGPVMIFGLYSRFGTTAGAFTSLISGMVLSLGSIFIQRNWANLVYPFLQENNLVTAVGNFLTTVSGPLNPYVVWEMNAVKCPINSYEFYFMTMAITFALYCIVSYLTCKKPFNLERMLHRGKYAIDGEKKIKLEWTFKKLFSNLIGITPEYTRGDKAIAWGLFIYSFIYSFFFAFIVVMIWNFVTPWPIEWWGKYFVYLLIPGIVAFFSTIWFGIGGAFDLVRLFRDLEARKTVNDLDNGMVEGNMSLADKSQLEEIDKENTTREDPKK